MTAAMSRPKRPALRRWPRRSHANDGCPPTSRPDADHAVHRPVRTESDTSTSGRVIVGFDGSRTSYDALAFASGWARRSSAELVVAHVADVSWQWAAEGLGGAPLAPVMEEVAAELSNQVTEAMSEAAQSWTYVATSGSVAHELESLANEMRADAIVVGRSRRRNRTLGRAVASRLTRCTHRIVIVVP
jgi:nucleotide-binding universal stress UspA family protein